MDDHTSITEMTLAPVGPPIGPIPPIAKVTGAISSVMREIGPVEKSGFNQFHNYKYPKMEDILQALVPLMGKNGIVVFQSEVERETIEDGTVLAVRYEFMIAHESGEIWPWRILQTGVSKCRDSRGGYDDKAANKAHTAARKYFLMSLFQIPTGEIHDADRGDNDGDTPGRKPASRSPAKEAPAKEPATKGDEAEPQEILGRGAKDWHRLFLAAVKTAIGPQWLMGLQAVNTDKLDKLKTADKKLYDDAMAAVAKRLEQLEAEASTVRPTQSAGASSEASAPASADGQSAADTSTSSTSAPADEPPSPGSAPSPTSAPRAAAPSMNTASPRTAPPDAGPVADAPAPRPDAIVKTIQPPPVSAILERIERFAAGMATMDEIVEYSNTTIEPLIHEWSQEDKAKARAIVNQNIKRIQGVVEPTPEPEAEPDLDLGLETFDTNRWLSEMKAKIVGATRESIVLIRDRDLIPNQATVSTENPAGWEALKEVFRQRAAELGMLKR